MTNAKPQTPTKTFPRTCVECGAIFESVNPVASYCPDCLAPLAAPVRKKPGYDAKCGDCGRTYRAFKPKSRYCYGCTKERLSVQHSLRESVRMRARRLPNGGAVPVPVPQTTTPDDGSLGWWILNGCP